MFEINLSLFSHTAIAFRLWVFRLCLAKDALQSRYPTPAINSYDQNSTFWSSLWLTLFCSCGNQRFPRTPRVFPIPKAHKFAKGLWASPSIGFNKAKLIACLYFHTRLTLLSFKRFSTTPFRAILT